MNNPILSLEVVCKELQSKERTFTSSKNVNLCVERGEYLAIAEKYDGKIYL